VLLQIANEESVLGVPLSVSTGVRAIESPDATSSAPYAAPLPQAPV
jgi:hypothetical protein